MFSCYKNTQNEVISSRLWEIYLIKDVWRDWDDGRIGDGLRYITKFNFDFHEIYSFKSNLVVVATISKTDQKCFIIL